jgi:hypothetical protein
MKKQISHKKAQKAQKGTKSTKVKTTAVLIRQRETTPAWSIPRLDVPSHA